MEKENFWLDSISLELWTRYIKNYISGVYNIERIKGEDIIKIEYSMRNLDEDFVSYLTPFGITDSYAVVDGYKYGLSHPATKELFNLMHISTKNKIVNGKTYAEAFKEAHLNTYRRKHTAKINSLDAQIKNLETEKKEAIQILMDSEAELVKFINPIITSDKKEKSLIVEDILKGMSPEEQAKLLAKLGYAPVKEEKKDEKVVINNGLNDIVLDFDKPKTTEIDEDDSYYV